MIITLQIVNYNSREYLGACFNSIGKALLPGKELQVILINNDTEPLDALEIKKNTAFEVEVVEVGKNLGFGKAHNLGFKKAKGELVLFLNPDTRVSENAIVELAEILEKNPDVGITGPLLVGDGGTIENEHCGAKKTPFSIIKAKIVRRKFSRFSEATKVEWLSGGAMMVRKDLFSELGGFDENYFMYYEDVDFCLRARGRNVRVIVNPRAKVFHSGGKSYKDSKEKKKHYYVSQVYYLRKNFGILPALLVKIMRFPLYFKNVYFEQ